MHLRDGGSDRVACIGQSSGGFARFDPKANSASGAAPKKHQDRELTGRSRGTRAVAADRSSRNSSQAFAARSFGPATTGKDRSSLGGYTGAAGLAGRS